MCVHVSKARHCPPYAIIVGVPPLVNDGIDNGLLCVVLSKFFIHIIGIIYNKIVRE